MNIYLVEVDSNTHYVRAPNKLSAIRHIIDNVCTARLCSHDDLMNAFQSGAEIEGYQEPVNPTDPLFPESDHDH